MYVIHFHSHVVPGFEYTLPTASNSLLRVSGNASQIQAVRQALSASSQQQRADMAQASREARRKNAEYFFRGRFKVLEVGAGEWSDDDDDYTPYLGDVHVEMEVEHDDGVLDSGAAHHEFQGERYTARREEYDDVEGDPGTYY